MVLLGGAATAPSVAWPRAAEVQQATLPVIGMLGSGSLESSAPLVAGFDRGLKEAGYVAGQNLTLEHRWGEGHFDRLAALAEDLVRRKVAVIFAFGGDGPARAAKAASTTIPIVFANGGDPVKIGLVASLNRPGGNVTGISFYTTDLLAKRLELLRELVPAAATIAFLASTSNLGYRSDAKELEAAARAAGQQLHVVEVKVAAEGDFEPAFARMSEQSIGAVLVDADPFFRLHRHPLIALAARHSIPVIYNSRDYPVAGGLISYGSDVADAYRHAGIYTGRILKGTKPAELSVMQPTKFELVVNLKTAKALGLAVPDKLLAIADEVVE
jgi:putative ABC transport system substrate-binding protein